jgi:hypothetical protein
MPPTLLQVDAAKASLTIASHGAAHGMVGIRRRAEKWPGQALSTIRQRVK